MRGEGEGSFLDFVAWNWIQQGREVGIGNGGSDEPLDMGGSLEVGLFGMGGDGDDGSILTGRGRCCCGMVGCTYAKVGKGVLRNGRGL